MTGTFRSLARSFVRVAAILLGAVLDPAVTRHELEVVDDDEIQTVLIFASGTSRSRDVSAGCRR
jgi:hypothetical protein